MTGAALLCGLLLAAPLPPPRPRLPPRGDDGDRGTVTQVTAHGAYLDRGAADGLQPGTALKLVRRGKPAGTCTVAQLADHSALCTGAGLEPGDAFRFARPRPVKPKLLPAPPSEAELARQRAVLLAAERPLVEYKSSRRRGQEARARLLEVSFGHTTWTTGGMSGAAFHLEQLDFAVRRLTLLRDWKLSLDGGVHFYSGRPDAFRDPVASPIRLLVRELAIDWDGRGLRWRLALGRMWTRNLAGVSALDGIVGAWKPLDGFEVGAFAGLLPEASTAGISLERWTAGVFQAWEWRGPGAVSWVRQQLRAAAVGRPEPRGEVELLAQAGFAHPFDVEAGVRLGFGDGPFSLDLVKLALSWRPVAPLSFQLSGRYVGRLPHELVLPLAPATGAPALHLDGAAGWELVRGLVVGGRAGFVRDFDAQLSRFWGGPEIALPRLFAGRGGLRAGWVEETGHVGRRSVWLAADVDLFELARLWSRFGWTQQSPTAGTGEYSAHELGLQVALDFTLPLGFSVRASYLVHGGLGGDGSAADTAVRTQSSAAHVFSGGVGWAW